MTSDEGTVHQERFHALLRSQRDRLVLPWLGTMMSVGVCSIILTVATGDEAPDVSSGLRYGLFAAALLVSAASIVLPRRLLADAAIAAQMRTQPEARTLSGRLGLDADDYVTAVELSKQQLRLLGLLTLFRTPYFVSLALSEAVALVGLAAGLLHDNVLSAAPYFLLSFVLHAIHYPRFDRLMERGRKLDQPDEELQALSQTLDKIHDDFARPRKARTTGEAKVPRERNPSRPITLDKNPSRPIAPDRKPSRPIALDKNPSRPIAPDRNPSRPISDRPPPKTKP